MANTIQVRGVSLTQDVLRSGSVVTSHAMVGETLAADQLIMEVSTEPEPFIPADQEGPLITADHHAMFCSGRVDVSSFRSGDELRYIVDNSIRGKFFLQTIKRMGQDRYKITAVSIIGLLLDSEHYGGIYNGVAAAVIFADILSGVSYTLDQEVAAATVTGYLPISSRRDNLQQLLMATGSTVSLNASGTLQISAMSPVKTGTFDASRCYVGGSVNTASTVVGVQLTEHNYFPAGNTITLYSDGVDGEEFIKFSEPYHDLQITGGSIVASGANYARISGKGSVVLTGQPYTHVTRVVMAGSRTATSTQTVKTVSGCYLANPQISQALADRLYNYLKCDRTISQDVLAGAERAGDVVSIINPYTMVQETGTIQSLDLTMSGINKAKVNVLVGFLPSGTISGFKNYAILTGSGSWTVPSGVTKIRIILVGAGSGGSGGYNGANGEDGYASATGAVPSAQQTEVRGGKGGKGGNGGAAGKGGKIYEYNADVTPGQSFAYSCGVGGVGGAVGEGGSSGSETTFGVYSSANGKAYQYGYVDAKTGLNLGGDGAAGTKGGDGGNGTDQIGYGAGIGGNGDNIASWTGGNGSDAWTFYSGVDDRTSNDVGGAGGGGAAVGSNGGNASRGNNVQAGVGANASVPAKVTSYGGGGSGGNGGGGGGGGTTGSRFTSGDWVRYISTFSGGAGGIGSSGGSGGDGCIVIYY